MAGAVMAGAVMVAGDTVGVVMAASVTAMEASVVDLASVSGIPVITDTGRIHPIMRMTSSRFAIMCVGGFTRDMAGAFVASFTVNNFVK
jgi:uncharacterized protein YigE (DUF2233 family)